MKAQHIKAITEGVLDDHENALDRLNITHRKVQREKQKEIASWDAKSWQAEIQVYSILIDQAVSTKSGPFDGA